MRSRFNDVCIGGAIVAFGAFVLLVLIPFGVVDPDHIPARAITPAFWPKATGWMLVAFGILIALEGVLTRAKNGEAETISVASFGDAGRGLPRIFLGFTLLYAIWGIIGWIGLPVASGVIILTFGALFGERRLWLLAITAVLLPLTLYYFFSDVVNVPIPVGSLFE